jgi:hypothetical protein
MELIEQLSLEQEVRLHDDALPALIGDRFQGWFDPRLGHCEKADASLPYAQAASEQLGEMTHVGRGVGIAAPPAREHQRGPRQFLCGQLTAHFAEPLGGKFQNLFLAAQRRSMQNRQVRPAASRLRHGGRDIALGMSRRE